MTATRSNRSISASLRPNGTSNRARYDKARDGERRARSVRTHERVRPSRMDGGAGLGRVDGRVVRRVRGGRRREHGGVHSTGKRTRRRLRVFDRRVARSPQARDRAALFKTAIAARRPASVYLEVNEHNSGLRSFYRISRVRESGRKKKILRRGQRIHNAQGASGYLILDLDLGVSVNVAVARGSGLPVVFMHGWGASSAAFFRRSSVSRRMGVRASRPIFRRSERRACLRSIGRFPITPP